MGQTSPTSQDDSIVNADVYRLRAQSRGSMQSHEIHGSDTFPDVQSRRLKMAHNMHSAARASLSRQEYSSE
jgi:hypothetical protein